MFDGFKSLIQSVSGVTIKLCTEILGNTEYMFMFLAHLLILNVVLFDRLSILFPVSKFFSLIVILLSVCLVFCLPFLICHREKIIFYLIGNI